MGTMKCYPMRIMRDPDLFQGREIASHGVIGLGMILTTGQRIAVYGFRPRNATWQSWVSRARGGHFSQSGILFT